MRWYSALWDVWSSYGSLGPPCALLQDMLYRTIVNELVCGLQLRPLGSFRILPSLKAVAGLLTSWCAMGPALPTGCLMEANHTICRRQPWTLP